MLDAIGGLKGLGVLFGIGTTIVGAIVGYVKMGNRVNAHDRDISKNDERLRKEIEDQDGRNDKRFNVIEDDVKLLRKDQASSNDKLIRMEADISHTKDVVDSMYGDLKTIAEQVTIVATKIDIDK